ncbi:group II intron reverse transcriptase/maturase [Desulforamulus ferrireducens]|uniref:RNA-directed DNA polymerase n=2 Tax=Desulforamulus ferrireducens TaxID=1833852 RepID=A0A1S6IWK7_9FIRM|nr:group II intron reverse transcriptase/maturase [Desulforamulus ferrireducens]
MGSSRGKQRQQKIPKGNYLQEEAVNTQGTGGGPSLSPARTKETTREESCNNLMERVVARDNMLYALYRVEANKGAAGIDGMTIESLRPFLKDQWPVIREQLLKGTYQPKPVRRVEIPKPDGGTRLLGIPTVIDRLIQQALLQKMNDIFEPTFVPFSFGFRPHKRAHSAVELAREYIKEGYRWVVDMDLEKFFDKVNHDILMSKVSRRIQDKRVLLLIRRYLQAGVMVNGCCIATGEGTPQGGPLSPLLANIMLNDLDWELWKRGHRFVRYADDCNIYVKSRRAGERVMASVKKFVEERLKLKVNMQKSAVDRPWKRKFLGFSFTWDKEPKIRIAPKTKKRFMDKIRELTNRSKSQSMNKRIKAINTYIVGWIGYYRLADTRSVFQSLDEWLRRRLRMCYLKQWKKPKTKRKKLVALGIPPEWAMLISGSRKGYWRLSNTPQVNKALGLAFWQEQGLKSLVERYNELRSTT